VSTLPSTPRKKLTADEWAVLILLIAFILGSWLRVYQALDSRYPLNDGGMFLTMINDLRSNANHLPDFTTYNRSAIPYTYPPLPFYLAALMADLTGFSVIDLLRWLPAIASCLCLIAFYALATSVFEGDRLKSALATAAYAFVPGAIYWTLMGGGLTRAFGQLFLLLTTWQAYLLFTRRRVRHHLGTILFASLLVLCHPEASLQAAAFCVLIWLIRARSKTALWDGLAVTAGTALLTSIWWIPMLVRHGLAPFLSAMASGGSGTVSSLGVLTFNFTQEPLMTLLAALGFIGIFVTCAQRKYLFAAWLVIPFLVDPRSKFTVAAVPISLLAAIALTGLVFPTLFSIENHREPLKKYEPFGSLTGRIFLITFLVYICFADYLAMLQVAPARIDSGNIQAMEWVKAKTDPGTRFIVLTGQQLWACDPVQEWFPAIADRTSLTTLQGQEWLLGSSFATRQEGLQGLQACENQSSGCLEKKAFSLHMVFDYVYVSRTIPTGPCLASTPGNPSILNDLQNSPNYNKVYETDSVAIFKHGHG
jgi:hypothetical protein